MEVKSLSRVQLVATPWTAAHQAPPSMGFSRQEYWSGVPLPSPRSLLVICFMHVYASHSAMSDSLPPYELSPARLLSPWDFPGKSTGVGCHCLLREMMLKDTIDIKPRKFYFNDAHL